MHAQNGAPRATAQPDIYKARCKHVATAGLPALARHTAVCDRYRSRGKYRCCALGQRAAHVQHCRALCNLCIDVAFPARLAEAVIACSRAHLLHRIVIEADLALILQSTPVSASLHHHGYPAGSPENEVNTAHSGLHGPVARM